MVTSLNYDYDYDHGELWNTQKQAIIYYIPREKKEEIKDTYYITNVDVKLGSKDIVEILPCAIT